MKAIEARPSEYVAPTNQGQEFFSRKKIEKTAAIFHHSISFRRETTKGRQSRLQETSKRHRSLLGLELLSRSGASPPFPSATGLGIWFGRFWMGQISRRSA